MILQDNEYLSAVVESAPIGICILNAEDLTVQMLNDKFLEIAGKPSEAILGKWYWEPFAEAKPYYEEALEGVLQTGKAYYADEVELMLMRHGKQEWVFVTFVYSPVKNTDDKVTKIVVWVLENTSQVKQRQQLQALNEEPATTNEELLSTNDELIATQHQLQSTIEKVETSNQRFRNMIQSSPVAMLVTLGDNMVFEEINDAMLLMIGKDSSVKGKPWFEAIPELVGQPVIDELYHTYHTGEEHKVSAAPITLIKNGQPYYGFYNITYTALIEEGKITGVMQSVVDVTGYITAKNELTKAYEQVRLSKEAAELGTFDMNMETGDMEWDVRCRQLFGLSHQNKVDFEKDFSNNLHPEDRNRVSKVLDRVFNKAVSGGVYDVEYRTIGVEDQKLRWVRAKGQVYYGENDQPLRFIGSVLDITEQKADEQRKNDFIGMVSHELKTPLTSMTAILQVLKAKLGASEDPFIPLALQKANQQVTKMSSMINGFLNISRLAAGRMQIDRKSFDLDHLLIENTKEIELIFPGHMIQYMPYGPVLVNADRDKIDSVISNLLSNAIKYSPKGSLIDLKCQTVKDGVCVSIKDRGIGIKEEDQTKLFDRYYRVESNAAHISGFGIGLYLCAEIVGRHDGRIWLESEVGKGSTFYFSLPSI